MTLLFALSVLSGCNQEKKRALLWKISKDADVIYLQGVVHAGPARYVSPSSLTLNIFNASKHLIVESTNQDPRQEYRQRSAKLSDDNQALLKKLLDRLSADGLLLPTEHADIFEFDITHYDHAFAPSFSNQVARSKGLSNLIGDSRLGIDTALANLALTKGIHVSGLEQNYNQRLTWHKTCDVNELYPSILKSYEQMIYENQYVVTMHDIYLSVAQGNFEKAQASITSLERALPHYRINGVCSYHPRTKQWAENWDSLMKRAPNGLVLVGAYHVTQEPSLLTLLSEKGYTIERLP